MFPAKVFEKYKNLLFTLFILFSKIGLLATTICLHLIQFKAKLINYFYLIFICMSGSDLLLNILSTGKTYMENQKMQSSDKQY